MLLCTIYVYTYGWQWNWNVSATSKWLPFNKMAFAFLLIRSDRTQRSNKSKDSVMEEHFSYFWSDSIFHCHIYVEHFRWLSHFGWNNLIVELILILMVPDSSIYQFQNNKISPPLNLLTSMLLLFQVSKDIFGRVSTKSVPISVQDGKFVKITSICYLSSADYIFYTLQVELT